MITVTLSIARTVVALRIIWPMLMADSLVGGMPAIVHRNLFAAAHGSRPVSRSCEGMIILKGAAL